MARDLAWRIYIKSLCNVERGTVEVTRKAGDLVEIRTGYLLSIKQTRYLGCSMLGWYALCENNLLFNLQRCINCLGYVTWNEIWWSVGNEEWIAMRRKMILDLFLD